MVNNHIFIVKLLLSLKDFSILYRMVKQKCTVCNHLSDSAGSCHDRCRTHAACARGSQYTSNGCAVCEDLWRRAMCFHDYNTCVPAFNILNKWIGGFSRNSRNRPAGLPIFIWLDERLDYFEIRVIINNLK